jgi:hypothetical protein
VSKLISGVSWPQAVVLVALVAGAVCASIWAPEDVRGALVGLLTAIAGWLRVQK